MARRQSVLYQLQKFPKRNKAVAAGSAIATSALFIGFLLSTSLYFQADNARQGEQEQRFLAEQPVGEAVAARADELETVTEFQASMLGDLGAEAMGLGIIKRLTEDVRQATAASGGSPNDIAASVASLEEFLKGVKATNLALAVVDDHVLRRAVHAIEKDFADQPVVRAVSLGTVAGHHDLDENASVAESKLAASLVQASGTRLEH